MGLTLRAWPAPSLAHQLPSEAPPHDTPDLAWDFLLGRRAPGFLSFPPIGRLDWWFGLVV